MAETYGLLIIFWETYVKIKLKPEPPLPTHFMNNYVRRKNQGFPFVPRLKELKCRTPDATLAKRPMLLGKLRRTIMSIFGVRSIKLIPEMGMKLRAEL